VAGGVPQAQVAAARLARSDAADVDTDRGEQAGAPPPVIYDLPLHVVHTADLPVFTQSRNSITLTTLVRARKSWRKSY
jgi:hypothetical protein